MVWKKNSKQWDKFLASSQHVTCCGYKNEEAKDLSSIREWTGPVCEVIHRDIMQPKTY